MTNDAQVIAIDIGGTTTKLALVNPRGQLDAWRSLPTTGPDAPAFCEKLLFQIHQLQGAAARPVAGVSLAMAGFVSAQGILTYNPNLAWLANTPIASMLAENLHLPISAESDSNAACIAEYLFGQGSGSSRFLCLTGGTGLGVGMVADGHLVRVAHRCMGDAGHIILSPEGPPCSCGGRGCAEAFLSTETLGRRYGALSGSQTGFRALVEKAHSQEPSALLLLTEAGYWLGIAAASLAGIFFPDRIAIAGGLSHAGAAFFAAAQASFRKYGGEFPTSGVQLVRATSGEHATLLGAAACSFHPELLAERPSTAEHISVDSP